MVDQVPSNGFNIPALPASANVHERQPAAAMVPGFVPPPANVPAPAPAAVTYTQAQVDAMLAASKPAAPEAPTTVPMSPGSSISTSELSGAQDPVIKSLTSVFLATGNGVDIDRAIGKALLYGDASLIDTAYINEKGGANAAHLATMAQAIVDRVQTQAAAGEAAAYAVAGDKAQWQAAASAFDQKAPAHLKTVIKAMLDSGNPESISAAAKNVVEFARSSGLVPIVPGLVGAGASTVNAGQALNKADFQAAHSKLNPNSPSYAADRGQLFQRRQLGKGMGI